MTISRFESQRSTTGRIKGKRPHLTRRRTYYRRPFAYALVILVLLLALLSQHCAGSQPATDEDGNDEYDEFVQQVLDEEEAHYSDGAHFDRHGGTNDDEQKEARLHAEAEKERMAREEQRAAAEQVRLQREAEFEAELARMNREQQKAARKQKKRDARIVRQVLKADRKGKLYAVLGLRNFDLHIGPVTLLRCDTGAIRRAYRTRARAVHPDRNRDGRAQEAFIAVENAASVLSDEEQRGAYDEEVRLVRLQHRSEMKRHATSVKNAISKNVSRVIWVFRRIFGPFATPIFILGCLMV